MDFARTELPFSNNIWLKQYAAVCATLFLKEFCGVCQLLFLSFTFCNCLFIGFYGNSVALVSSMVKRRESRRAATCAETSEKWTRWRRDGSQGASEGFENGSVFQKVRNTESSPAAVSVAVFSSPKHRLEAYDRQMRAV